MNSAYRKLTSFFILLFIFSNGGCGKSSNPPIPSSTPAQISTQVTPEEPSNPPVSKVETAPENKFENKPETVPEDYVAFSGERNYSYPTEVGSSWNVFPSAFDGYLGAFSSSIIPAQEKILDDPASEKYLNNLVQSLNSKAKNGDKFNFHVKVLNGGTINAFALPGGYLYVYRGLIENVKNEAQLAGILSHEISHVNLRHSTRILTKKIGLATISLAAYTALVALNKKGNSSYRSDPVIAANLLWITNKMMGLKFSRSAETEADVSGTQILYDSGYYPLALSEFFQGMGRSSWQPWLNWFTTHPNSQNRIQSTSVEVSKLGGLHGVFKKDSPEFRAEQEHLKHLP